jgi:hypothetical protein
MKHRRLKGGLQKWQQADHKFAIAAVALMTFLFVAGLTNWFLASLLQVVRTRGLRQLVSMGAGRCEYGC